jgi:subtilisin family serine protease
VIFFSTSPTGAPDLHRLAIANERKVEYVLPVVQTLPTHDDPLASERFLVMTPRISARFTDADAGSPRDVYLSQFGLKVQHKQDHVPNGYLLTLTEGQVTYTRLLDSANKLYQQGRHDKRILYALPDFLPTRKRSQPHPTPIQDPLFQRQWHLKNTGQSGGTAGADIGATEAWLTTLGNPSIRIAIIDDSVEKAHPDLQQNYTDGRFYDGITGESTNDPSPKTPDEIHGTPCAGAAVGAANTIGIRGVAPRCGLLGLHIWQASTAQTADAFYFCDKPHGKPENGASVISCSWVDNGRFDDISMALRQLSFRGRGGRGTVILCAAGNQGDLITRAQKLATLANIICVGATNSAGDHSDYSNHGTELTLVAPSDDWHLPNLGGIITTDNTERMPRSVNAAFSGYAKGDYTATGPPSFGGTSAATALAAGVCGLVLSVNPKLTAQDVCSILQHTAVQIPGRLRKATYDPVTGHDFYYGYGRLDAHRAVRAATGRAADVWPAPIQHLTSIPVIPALPNAKQTVVIHYYYPRRHPLTGVLVIRGFSQVKWHPIDGCIYRLRQEVAPGFEVIRVDADDHGPANELLDVIGTEKPAHYALFAYNKALRYSWGARTSSTDQPAPDARRRSQLMALPPSF